MLSDDEDLPLSGEHEWAGDECGGADSSVGEYGQEDGEVAVWESKQQQQQLQWAEQGTSSSSSSGGTASRTSASASSSNSPRPPALQSVLRKRASAAEEVKSVSGSES